jgi:hypothetical protein
VEGRWTGEPEHGAAPWRLTSFKMEAEPDERAGTVSKTDRAPQVHGEHDLRLPPPHADLAELPCTRLVNETRPGQHQ